MRRALPEVLAIAVLGAGGSARAVECPREVEVLTSRARFATQVSRGRPTRRDVEVDVELRSTSTAAITGVELGVFLGVTLEEITQTRPETLPTRQTRTFASGGVAFRREVRALVPAGATRTVRVRETGLPLRRDLAALRVVVVGCRRAYPVGEATLATPPAEAPTALWRIAALLAGLLAIAVWVTRRLR